jgi:hypothetical protein
MATNTITAIPAALIPRILRGGLAQDTCFLHWRLKRHMQPRIASPSVVPAQSTGWPQALFNFTSRLAVRFCG